MGTDDQAFCELAGAIIVQAAMDYAEACKAGLIKQDSCAVDAAAITRRMRFGYPDRWLLPKGMEPGDIYSATWFLFGSEALDELIPFGWEVNPDAVRRKIIEAVSSGQRFSHR